MAKHVLVDGADSPHWLPFLHIGSVTPGEPAEPEDFRPHARLKKNALGPRTILTQELFEQCAQIALFEEDSLKINAWRSTTEEKIQSSDEVKCAEVTADTNYDNLYEGTHDMREAVSIEPRKSFSLHTCRLSNESEHGESCKQGGVQDFTCSPDNYITFIPPRKTEKRKVCCSVEIPQSSTVELSENVQKSLTNRAPTPNLRRKLPQDEDSKLQLPSSKTKFSEEVVVSCEQYQNNEVTKSGSTTTSMTTSSREIRQETSPECVTISPESKSCQIIIAYKSLNNSTDRLLTRSWLRWTGCWDAYKMLLEEFVRVKTITLYTCRGRCSQYSFPYIVIMDVFSPTTLEIQIVKSVSQRLRVERWKGLYSVYSSLLIANSSRVNQNLGIESDTMVEDHVRRQLATMEIEDGRDSCSCDEEDL